MRNIISLNDAWQFSKDCATTVHNDSAISIDLPHTWNATDGQDGGNDYFRGKCLYTKTIKKADLPEADEYYLEICGANSSADVYLNGIHKAHHDGGYSTWRVNLTDSLGEECEIAITVDNSPNEEVYPQMADFTFYGGLYRNVNLIAVSSTHFDLDYYGGTGVKVTPTVNGEAAKVEAEVFITSKQTGDEIEYTVLDREGETVATTKAADTSVTLTIENVHLWNGLADPYLYTLVTSIKRGDETVDEIKTRFGCRSFSVDPERGFILNGKEYPLRGVSRHQDRLGIGNALLPCHHKEDMDLILEVGATTIRLAHYQHDQYFYDLCDENGLVIWAEIPYISRHMPGGRENTVNQMKELVTQNYNHPSIVVWGLSNEITISGSTPDLLENHNILNDMVHEMDKTRLTTIAAVSMAKIDDPYIHISDLVSYNHYFGWYGGETDMNGPWFDKFHAAYPKTPIGCSEYGCEALNWHSSNPFQGDYTEEYQSYYHEELIKQLFTRKYLWATHVWNMFDFGADARAEGGENGQNHKGLVTMDRKYKKDSFYAYKAWLRSPEDAPFVHICSKRYVDRVEESTKITVYSNLPEVELFVNGESLGKKESAEHFFYFVVPNVGESTIEAVAGECRDQSFIRKVDTMNEEYILKEQGAILNWFDIDAPEGRYSLNDKIGDILKSFRGKLWFAKTALSIKKKMRGNKSGEKSGGFDIPVSGLMQMIKSFTFLRLASMVGMANISFTKEELLKLNEQLNRIKKPKSLNKKTN